MGKKKRKDLGFNVRKTGPKAFTCSACALFEGDSGRARKREHVTIFGDCARTGIVETASKECCRYYERNDFEDDGRDAFGEAADAAMASGVRARI